MKRCAFILLALLVFLVPTAIGQSTSNNTSACSANGVPTAGCNGVGSMPLSGNPSNAGLQTSAVDPLPTNVSNVSLKSLLYPGASTRILGAIQPWFCNSSNPCNGHLSIGMDESNSTQILKQLQSMKSVGIDVVDPDDYGCGPDCGQYSGQSFNHSVVKGMVAAIAANPSTTPKFALMIDAGAISNTTTSGTQLATNGTMTNGSAVLTSASAPFTAAMVGQPISVTGAGVSSGALHSAIASFQSSTQVTLVDNAATTTTTGVVALTGQCPATSSNAQVCLIGAFEDQLDYAARAYMNANYEIDSNGKALVLLFVDFTTNWPGTSLNNVFTAVVAHATAGNSCANVFNPAACTYPHTVDLIDENAGGFTESSAIAGGYAWVQPPSYSSANQFFWKGTSSNNYLTGFYSTARANPSKIAIGAIYKGFDDHNASWGSNRVLAQQCGQLPALTMGAIPTAGYSSSSQLPYVQLVTWNDYEEGTEVETGIDNCITIGTPLISGGTLSWSLIKSDPTYASTSTINSFSIYKGTSGPTTLVQSGISASATTATAPTLAPGESAYIYMLGGPLIQNRLGSGLPTISVSPANVSFGPQISGTTSAGQVITLTNVGTSPLNVTSIATAAPFADTTTCGATLAAGSACTITVTFSPTYYAPRSGVLTITSNNAAVSPVTVPLSGIGVAPCMVLYPCGSVQPIQQINIFGGFLNANSPNYSHFIGSSGVLDLFPAGQYITGVTYSVPAGCNGACGGATATFLDHVASGGLGGGNFPNLVFNTGTNPIDTAVNAVASRGGTPGYINNFILYTASYNGAGGGNVITPSYLWSQPWANFLDVDGATPGPVLARGNLTSYLPGDYICSVGMTTAGCTGGVYLQLQSHCTNSDVNDITCKTAASAPGCITTTITIGATCTDGGVVWVSTGTNAPPMDGFCGATYSVPNCDKLTLTGTASIVSNTATITVTAAPTFPNGQSASITGATGPTGASNFNCGNATVTSVGASTVSYTCSPTLTNTSSISLTGGTISGDHIVNVNSPNSPSLAFLATTLPCAWELPKRVWQNNLFLAIDAHYKNSLGYFRIGPTKGGEASQDGASSCPFNSTHQYESYEKILYTFLGQNGCGTDFMCVGNLNTNPNVEAPYMNANNIGFDNNALSTNQAYSLDYYSALGQACPPDGKLYHGGNWCLIFLGNPTQPNGQAPGATLQTSQQGTPGSWGTSTCSNGGCSTPPVQDTGSMAPDGTGTGSAFPLPTGYPGNLPLANAYGANNVEEYPCDVLLALDPNYSAAPPAGSNCSPLYSQATYKTPYQNAHVAFLQSGATVSTPTFSPAAGTYTGTQSVTISTSTTGATICFTTDGSTPTTNGAGVCTHGTTYSSPVSVAVSETLTAIGSKSANSDSAVASAAYGIQVAAPIFSPAAGTYTGTQSVTISTSTSGATLCFTTDGSTPTSNGAGVCTHGTTYSSAISVASSETLKALATKNGATDSAVITAAYTITIVVTVNPPTFSPVAGTYTSPQNVSLATTTSGATICYTTDGSTPTSNGAGTCTHGTTYSTAVAVSASETLKALGSKSGDADSSVSSAAYVIRVATPTFTPGAGTYGVPQTVTIATTTSGATLCYTTDGSTPAANGAGTCTHGTTYSAPVSVAASETLEAVGSKSGQSDSVVSAAVYVISGIAPSFTTPNNVSFPLNQAQTFNCGANGYPVPVFTETGSLPSGISFTDNTNGSCTIAGTGTSPSTTSFTLTATNSAGSVNQSFTLTIGGSVIGLGSGTGQFVLSSTTGVGVCGPPNFVCSNQSLATIQTPTFPPISTTPTQPYQASFHVNNIGYDTSMNPSGTNGYLVVTDATTAPTPNRSQTLVTGGADDESPVSCKGRADWSADCGSAPLYYIQVNDAGTTRIVTFDPTQAPGSQIVPNGGVPPIHTLANGGSGGWSHQLHNVYYRRSGTKILADLINANATAVTTETTFMDAAKCPGFSNPTYNSTFSFTVTGVLGIGDGNDVLNFFGATFGSADGANANWIFNYNPATNACQTLNATTGNYWAPCAQTATCNASAPTGTIPIAVYIHQLSANSDGSWLQISWNNCPSTCPSIGTYQYQWATQTLLQCLDSANTCSGHGSMLYTHFLRGNNPSPNIRAFTAETVFTPILTFPAALNDLHMSHGQVDAGDTNPVIVTTDGPPGTWSSPYFNEIFAMRYAGGLAGTTSRFGHCFISYASNENFQAKDCIGTIFPDGKYWIGNMDMLGQLGTDAQGKIESQIFIMGPLQ